MSDDTSEGELCSDLLKSLQTGPTENTVSIIIKGDRDSFTGAATDPTSSIPDYAYLARLLLISESSSIAFFRHPRWAHCIGGIPPAV